MSEFLVVDVGTPLPEFEEPATQERASGEWATVKVRYHGFAYLSRIKGRKVHSPEFMCIGSRWKFIIYPGGSLNSPDGMVAIFLHNLSDKSVNISFSFCVEESDGSKRKINSPVPTMFDPTKSKGLFDFAMHSVMVNSLVAGALIIDVRMKSEPSQSPTVAFISKNPSINVIQRLFMDEKSADVVFEVGTGKRKSNSTKKAKTGPITFYAHRLILQKCASQLAELCGSAGKGSPVSITDVKPEIFHHILHYVYGGKVADDDLRAHAKEIIEGADKYRISNLKLEAEASFVNSTPITVENMMEHLLYADAKNCALLKEAVMDFIIENHVEVLEKVPLKDLPEGPTMFADILAAMARGKKRNGNGEGSGEDQLSTMRISDLRRKVHEKGLDVDGSREMLIAALEEDS